MANTAEDELTHFRSFEHDIPKTPPLRIPIDNSSQKCY